MAAGIGAKAGLVLAGLGAAGAVGMAAVSLHGMIKAKEPEEKIDHATNFGWGVQTGAEIAVATELAGAGLSTVATIIGGVGGVVSTGLGIHKIIDGIKKKDDTRRVMGALDLGIGCAWLTASLTPAATIGTVVFITLAVTKIGLSSSGKFKEHIHKFLGLKQGDVKNDQVRMRKLS
jgi:hypothetical protein